MLIAEFTSRIPNMGERVAHIKSCELLEAPQLQLTWAISSEAKDLKVFRTFND